MTTKRAVSSRNFCVACDLRGIKKRITWRFTLCKECYKVYGYDREEWPEYLRFAVRESEKRKQALGRGTGQYQEIQGMDLIRSEDISAAGPDDELVTASAILEWKYYCAAIFGEARMIAGPRDRFIGDRWVERKSEAYLDAAQLLADVEKVSPKQARALRCLYYELTQQESAELMGISQQAFSKLLASAKETARKIHAEKEANVRKAETPDIETFSD